MNLAIFGATGGTGRHLLDQALAAGHHVTALVRTPAALPVTHERLRVLQGDVRDRDQAAAIAGQDAVVSALGPHERGPVVAVHGCDREHPGRDGGPRGAPPHRAQRLRGSGQP